MGILAIRAGFVESVKVPEYTPSELLNAFADADSIDDADADALYEPSFIDLDTLYTE